MAGLDALMSTLHPPSRESRRMSRNQSGSLFLRSCRTFIGYSPPEFTLSTLLAYQPLLDISWSAIVWSAIQRG